MDSDTKQGSSSVTEDKKTLISRKVWELETKTQKWVDSDGMGRINYKTAKGISNGETFIFVDNQTGKRYSAGKQNNRFYNLTTGDEIL